MSSEQFTPGAVALGTFDGMHPGHLAVIDRTVAEARAREPLPTPSPLDAAA